MIKVGNSYRIFREGLMEWLDAQKVNNTPEVLHNMWDLEVAPYPAVGKLENAIIDMKKEIDSPQSKKAIEAAAEQAGESATAYVVEAVRRRMEQEQMLSASDTPGVVKNLEGDIDPVE